MYFEVSCYFPLHKTQASWPCWQFFSTLPWTSWSQNIQLGTGFFCWVLLQRVTTWVSFSDELSSRKSSGCTALLFWQQVFGKLSCKVVRSSDNLSLGKSSGFHHVVDLKLTNHCHVQIMGSIPWRVVSPSCDAESHQLVLIANNQPGSCGSS